MRILKIISITLALAILTSQAWATSKPKTDLLGGVSVMSFGAKGDGKTDDTAAFQKAMDSLKVHGGVVLAPTGKYLIAGSLKMPQNVALTGVWQGPHLSTMKGTVILATGGEGDENGKPLFDMDWNTCVKGLTIIYPNQKPSKIVPYPWTFMGKGMHCVIENVTLANPYKAIAFPVWNEMHYIKNVYGCPLKEGIFVDRCTDIGRIEDVHFNPNYWTRMNMAEPWPKADLQSLDKFLRENLVAYHIGKTDWEYMTNCFCILAKIGYHFVKTANGNGNAVLTQCGADGTTISVQVDSCQPHAGIAFVNSQFMAGVIISDTNNGPVKFSNCGFWPYGGINNQARLDGNGMVMFTSCHFQGWAQKDPEAPCIVATAGALIVNGCDFFAAGKRQVTLGERVGSAAITSNFLRGGQKITNNSKGSVQIGLNTE